MIVSQTARIAGYGSDKNARRVSYLSAEEKAAVKEGLTVIIEGCPEYKGETSRRVVYVNGRYYSRMPSTNQE